MRIETSGIGAQELRRVKNRARKRGAAIIEFAVTAVAFLAFLFGIIDTCEAVYTYEFVTYAARSGARWAMVRGSSCPTLNTTAFCSPTDSVTTGADGGDVQTYVRSLNLPGIQASGLTVTTTWPGGGAGCSSGNTPGCPVKVLVYYPYVSSIPFVHVTTLGLTAFSQMVISQ
jgi:Flp pilus assembly protein TadG